jgi:hypothetical protein
MDLPRMRVRIGKMRLHQSETDQFSPNLCWFQGCKELGAYYTIPNYACYDHKSWEEDNLSCCDGTREDIDCPVIGWIDGKAITYHNL